MASRLHSYSWALLVLVGAITARAISIPKNDRCLLSSENVDVIESELDDVWPWQSFKTSSLRPPNMSITRNSAELGPGLIFFAPYPSDHVPSAGWVMTDNNDLVLGIDGPSPKDFRVQHHDDGHHITYWTGKDSEGSGIGHGYGRLTLLDDEYVEQTFNPVYPTLTQFGRADRNVIDIHEHQITKRGSVLTTIYNYERANLSTVGGRADAWIINSRVVEFGLWTGEVLFEWNPLDHVPLNASRQPIGRPGPDADMDDDPWDWIHINSVDVVGDDYLINARHTWTVYLVEGSGTIRWNLEGHTGGDFALITEDFCFRWQHDVRCQSFDEGSITLSMFDNHGAGIEHPSVPSRGLVFSLDLAAKASPKLLHKAEVSCEPIHASSQGSFQADVDMQRFFVGYGAVPLMREFSTMSLGQPSWEARFGQDDSVQSYRAYKQPWNATPRDWNPTLVIEGDAGYVSWNGATGLEQYNIYAGPHPIDLVERGCFLHRGFETQFVVDNACVQVGAVRNGAEIRRSEIVCR